MECPICESEVTGDFVCDNCNRKVCKDCFTFPPEQDEGGLCTECYDKDTTIKLTIGTREKLKNLGRKGETYEAIILKLLDNKKM